MLVDTAHRAAVRDHEDALTGMALRDPADSGENTLRVLFLRLALPALEGGGLLRGQALDGADVDLAQIRVDDDGNVEARADDLGGVPRAAQVARVDRVDRLAGEPLGEARACSRPRSFKGTSACPCQRRSAFQSVSPCRTRSSVVTSD